MSNLVRFRDWSTPCKLILVAALPLCFLIITAVVAIGLQHRTQRALEQVVSREMAWKTAVLEAEVCLLTADYALAEFLRAQTRAEAEQPDAEWQEAFRALDKWLAALAHGGTVGSVNVPPITDAGLSNDIEHLAVKAKEAYAEAEAMARIWTGSLSVPKGQQAATTRRVGAAMHKLDDLRHQMHEQVAAIQAELDKRAAAAVTHVRRTTRAAKVLLALLLLSAALISGSTSYLLSKAITSPLISAVQRIEAAAQENDLSVRLEVLTRDEFGRIGDAFNVFLRGVARAAARFRQAARRTAESSQELLAASEQIAASSQEMSSSVKELSELAERQQHESATASEALSQLSEAADQISQQASVQSESVTAAAKHAEQVRGATEQVRAQLQELKAGSQRMREVAAEGQERTEETTTAVAQIDDAVRGTGEHLEALRQMSGQIGHIVAAINDIADQTNLLALNAAIEAARAGEHGKGFAVVAEEVRKLAEQSQRSTEEIAEILDGMHRRIEQAAEPMARSISAVGAAVEAVRKASEGLEAIIQSVNQVDHNITEIGNNAEQMADAANQLLSIMSELSAASQQTAAAVEEIAASSQEAASAVAATADTTRQTATGMRNIASASEEQAQAAQRVAQLSSELAQLAQELAREVDVFKLPSEAEHRSALPPQQRAA